VAVGFGISNAEHFAQVGGFADAAVIGSAIVELIERSAPEAAPEAVSRFIKGLRLLHEALAR
jgi:tryptophan synthase alpha chain